MLRHEINKLDDLWAEAVKWSNGFKCEHCGIRGVRVEAAHVVGRRHRITRWGCYFTAAEDFKWSDTVVEELGVVRRYDLCGHCLCHMCHQQYDEHGPLECDIVERTIGMERKAQVQRKALQTVAKHQDYAEIRDCILAAVEPVGPEPASSVVIQARVEANGGKILKGWKR